MTTPGQVVDILFVDDDEDNLNVLKKRVMREFGQRGCEARFDFESKVDSAVDRILGRPSRYPVVMADLLFPAPGFGTGGGEPPLEPRGLEVVELARSVSSETVIVALTQGNIHKPQLESQASDAGADIVLRRSALLASERKGGPAELVRRIYALLCERDLVAFGPTLNIPEEPGMQSILYDAGETTLRLLMADVFGRQGLEPTKVALKYLTPGASGSRVVRATATLADGSHRNLLVKLGKSDGALRAEHHNYELSAGLYEPSLLVPYLSVCGPRNGWSALAMLFAPDVVTLRTWISGDRTATEVYEVMDRLFLGGGLATGYRDAVVSPMDRPIDLLRLTPFRRVLVRDAVEELAPALAHPAAAQITDADAVKEVIESVTREARVGKVSASDTPRGQLVCVAHGDLHGGNILISPERVVVVVDLAVFGRHHWASDVARLAADLLLRGLDAGVDSFFWSRFALWRETARRVGALDPTIEDERPQNRGVVAALRWIAEHKAAVLPPLAQHERVWEWHLALAEQLLRRTYSKDLPPAKRTLAMVAAYDQVVVASERVPVPHERF